MSAGWTIFLCVECKCIAITGVIAVYNQQLTADQTTTHMNVKIAVSRV